MLRKSFIKSLLALAVAPKLMAELNIPTIAKPLQIPTAGLFADLQLLVPSTYAALMERYGNENYGFMIETIGNVCLKDDNEPIKLKSISTYSKSDLEEMVEKYGINVPPKSNKVVLYDAIKTSIGKNKLSKYVQIICTDFLNLCIKSLFYIFLTH